MSLEELQVKTNELAKKIAEFDKIRIKIEKLKSIK